MRVTPVKKSFNRHAPGEAFDYPDKAAKILIRIGRLRAVIEDVEAEPAPARTRATYRRRDMRPEE